MTKALARRQESDAQVARLLAARHELEQARELGDVKHVADLAAALEVYARRQKLSVDAIRHAHALKIYALAKLGGMLAELDKNTGGRPWPTDVPEITPSESEGVIEEPPTLAEIGIDYKTSMLAQRLAELDEATVAAIADDKQTITEALRQYRNRHRPPVVLPRGTFRVLYADPPWHYSNSGANPEHDDFGRAAQHYQTMTIDELCALDVRALAAPDAVLFLWVTSPLLAEVWPVIDAWGFTYKSSIVWDKVAHNYGNYVSVRHELLLICTRGSCLPDHPTPMPDSVIAIRRTAHSVKPDEFRQLIDSLYDGGADQKIELFARRAVEGWSAWGNEVAA